MSKRSPARVVVVIDHALLAEALELAVRAEGYVVRRIVLPAVVGTLAPVVSAITGDKPDIALVDIDQARFGDGLRLVAPLARNHIQVVALTAFPLSPRWGEAVRYGASVVLSRARPLTDILTIVQRLASGLPVMSREQRDQLVEQWQQGQVERRETLARLERLTGREAEILGQLQAGRQVRLIAETSGVSVSTVRTQVKAILAKLAVSTQLGAVSCANQVGWQPPAVP